MTATLTDQKPQTETAPAGELSLFRQQDQIIAQILQDCATLTVKGVEDRKGLEAVHEGRMRCVKARTSLDKTRKAMNEKAQEHIRRINAEAKRLTDQLEPVESRLKKLEDDTEAEKSRIKQAAEEARKVKVKARFDALKAAAFDGDYMAVPELADDAFAALLAKAQAAKVERDRLAEEERQRQAAEAERLRKLEAEAATQRAKDEAEAAEKRRQEEAAAAEQRRKEQVALEAERARLAEQKRLHDEQAAMVAAEQQKIADAQEAERKRLAEQQRQIELEKARQEAAERARVETEQRLKREAAQREEAERRHAEQLKAEAEAREAARLAARTIDDRDTLLQAANKVCGHLPDGWRITIELERDSGSVVLDNPDGDEVEFASNHESMAQSLSDALECAIGAAE